MSNSTNDELYKFLEKLKKRECMSVRELTPDELSFAESLVEMRLASKVSTRTTTFYFYGVPDGKL